MYISYMPYFKNESCIDECVCDVCGGGGWGGGEAAAPSFEESQINDTTACLNQGSYINLAVSGRSKVLKEGNKVFVIIIRLY